MGKSVLLTFIPMYVHQILLNFHRDRQDPLGFRFQLQDVNNLAGSLQMTDHVSITSIPKSRKTHTPPKCPQKPRVCKKKNSYNELKLMCQEHVDARGYKSLVAQRFTKTKDLATQKQNFSAAASQKERIQRSTTSKAPCCDLLFRGCLHCRNMFPCWILLPRSTFRLV